AKSSSFVNQNMIIDTIKKEALIAFKTERYHPDIYYTLDGTPPSQHSLKYTAPFASESGTIKASVLENGHPVGKESIKRYIIRAANYKKVRVDTISKWVENVLTNGVKAAPDYRDKEWFKFKERDLNVLLDLGKAISFSHISTSFFQHTDHFIFLPEHVQFAVSVDGLEFTPIDLVRSAASNSEKGPFIKDFQSGRINSPARFIKVTAKNLGLSPKTHYAPGQKAWLYLDEISVN
ncbi:MAG TPA: FN3 associated domain-containing protein, partial [Sphingobacteriaceae bacterium]